MWSYLKESRPGLEYRIREAMHFLGGDQWIRYLPYFNRFDRHIYDEWVPTPVTNYLVEHFDYLVQIFIGGDPMPVVDPATRDLPDVDAAKSSQRALHSEFNRMVSKLSLLQAAGWLVMSGNCVYSSGWNPKAGSTIRQPKMKLINTPVTKDVGRCQMCGYTEDAELSPERCARCNGNMVIGKTYALDEYGRQINDTHEEQEKDEHGYPAFDRITVGQLEEEVVNLLNWYPQPAREFSKSRFVQEIYPIDIDEAKEIFGSKAGKLEVDTIERERWNGSYTVQGSDFNAQTKSQERDQALLRITRHIPSKVFPKGCLQIGSRTEILYKGELDSCDGELPYTHILYRKIPELFWGLGPIGDILPQQKRINAIDSNIVMNRKQMVNPQWLVPASSGMTRTSGQSGLINQWDPQTTMGFKPERLPGVPLPQQVLEERGATVADMRHVDGLQEITTGNLPVGSSGLETGAAVEFLYEQAYKRFRASLDNWREGLAHHWKRNLMVIAKYWSEERLVRVLGENSELEAFFYRGADFYGAQDMSVRISLGGQTSKVAYKQTIMNAAREGLLGDLRNPEIRGKVLEAMEIEGFDSEYVKDAKKARRAIKAIREGEQPPQILPQIDNHAIQFSIARDFILTSDFEKESTEVQQGILQWAGQHQQIMQQMQQQTMMAAQAAKGTSPQVSNQIAQSGAMGPEAVATQSVGG